LRDIDQPADNERSGESTKVADRINECSTALEEEEGEVLLSYKVHLPFLLCQGRPLFSFYIHPDFLTFGIPVLQNL
jgi:hypothetical protein